MIRYWVALGVVIASISCRTGRPSVCDSDQKGTFGLQSVLSSDWLRLTPDTLARQWPDKLLWWSEAAGERACSGTATLSYLGKVMANECVCCDIFAFTDLPRSGGCDRFLSSVSLVRSAATETDARYIASELFRAINPGSGSGQLTLPSTIVVRQITPTLQEVAQIDVSTATQKRWRIRLMVYRVDMSEAYQSKD